MTDRPAPGHAPARGSNKFPDLTVRKPNGPERRDWGVGLEDNLDAADAAFEEGHQAARDLFRLHIGLFFSAGDGFLVAPHMPVETAQ